MIWVGRNGRSVWNQADYRITNINDDLTLPSTADRSWESHNSYLAQAGVEGLLGDLSLTISHDLGVDFTPELGLITPSPVTTNGLVEWTIDFPASGMRELTVPGTIPALAAGDSVAVSDGTVIDGTLTTPLGINVPIHVELGPTFVYAPHLLTLSPDRASVPAGDAAAFTLEVTNPGDAAETYSLEIGGIDGAAVDLADTATVGPGETVALTLAIATDPSLSNVSQDFVVTATGTLGGQDKVVGTVEIGANLLRPATTGGVVLGLTEHDLQVGAAGTAQTEVVVTNTGSREMLYNLSVTLPPGFGGGLLRTRLTVAPGDSRRTTLTLIAPDGLVGSASATVRAVAEGDPQQTDNVVAMLTVLEQAVELVLSPPEADLDSNGTGIVEATITNRGSQGGVYGLEGLGVFAANTCFRSSVDSCTQTTQLQLASGERRVLPVEISGTGNEIAGKTLFGVSAVALSNPAVADRDIIQLNTLPQRALSLAVLDVPEERFSLDRFPFRLRISNDGNACDERYVVRAQVEPSGLAIDIPSDTFVVPPKATVELDLAAVVSDYGTYQVRIDVESVADTQGCNALPPAQRSARFNVSVRDATGSGPVPVPSISIAGLVILSSLLLLIALGGLRRRQL